MLSSHLMEQKRQGIEPTKDKAQFDSDFLEDGYQDCFPHYKSLKQYLSYEKKLELINIHNEQKQWFLNDHQFKRKITQYLNEMIEGVCSKSFKLSANDESRQFETNKQTSKIILSKIKYLCLDIAQTLSLTLEEEIKKQINKEHFFLEIQGKFLQRLVKEKYQTQEIKEKIKKINKFLGQMAEQICKYTNSIVKELYRKCSNLPKNYIFEKIRSQIKLFNFENDYQIDFLHLNELFINKSNKKEYFSKIMEFINKVVIIPFQSIYDQGSETYQQSFVKLNEKLVWTISQPNISQHDISTQNKNLLGFLLQSPEKTILKGGEQQNLGNQHTSKQQKQENIKQMQSTLLLARYFQQSKNSKQIDKEIQNDIIKQENKIKFFIDPLRPSDLFSQNQMKNDQLQIKNAHQLSLLITWIKEIKETFERCQQNILQTVKIVNKKKQSVQYTNRQIKLNENQKNYLNRLMKDAYQRYKDQNKQQSSFIIAECLIQQQDCSNQLSKSLSLLNSYITKEALKIIIQLFQILFQVAQNFKQQMLKNGDSYLLQNLQEIQSLNLISNNIDDILSSRIQCNQSQFIKLLKLIYVLNDQCKKGQNIINSPFFRVVKVKDMLEETNSIIINYILYGKVPCRLQIIFEQIQDESKVKSSIQKYLYKLANNPFGVIPQLALTIHENNQNNSKYHFLHDSSSFSKNGYKESDMFIFQERVQSKSQKLQHAWRCINKKCEQYCFWGSCKFIKQDNKFYCLACYSKIHRNYNIYYTLAKLQFSQSDKWIKKILQKYNRFYLEQVRSINLQQDNNEGVYLMFYPTERKVIVEFIFLFKQTIREKFIIKSLTNNRNIQTKMFGQNQNNELYNKKFILLRVAQQILRICFHQTKDQKYIRYLQNQYLEQQKSEALAEYEKDLLQKEFLNKSNSIKLNQLIHALPYFQLQSDKLIFLKKLFAQSSRIKDIFFSKKLVNLTQLHLKHNCIAGSVLIENYKKLSFVDLSYNLIESIFFKNLQNVKEILLKNNQLFELKYEEVKKLQILQLQNNKFTGQMVFQELLNLKYLNISNHNGIVQLNLEKCRSLKRLNCFKLQSQQMSIIFSSQVFLQQLQAYYLSKQSLKAIKVSKLKSLKICLTIYDVLQLYQKQQQFCKLKDLKVTLTKAKDNQFVQKNLLQEMIKDSKKDQKKKRYMLIKKIKKIQTHLLDLTLLKQKLEIAQKSAQVLQLLKFIELQVRQQYYNQKYRQDIHQDIHSLIKLKNINLSNIINRKYQDIIDQEKIVQQFIKRIGSNLISMDIQLINDQSKIENLSIQSLRYLQLLKVKSNDLKITIRKIKIEAPKQEKYQIHKPENIKQPKLITPQINNFNFKCSAKDQINQSKGLHDNLIFQEQKAIQQISINSRGQAGQCRFKNNLELQKIYLQGFSINSLQIYNCNKIQILNLNSKDKYMVIKRAYILLPNIQQLQMNNLFIDNLHLKISAKPIKRLQLDSIIKKPQISFYDGESSFINLQHLCLSNYSLASLKDNNLFTRINTIQRISYKMKSKPQNVQKLRQFEEQLKVLEQQKLKIWEIKLSKICKKVEELNLLAQPSFNDKIKIIIDVPIMALNFDTQRKQMKGILEFQDSFFVNKEIQQPYNSIKEFLNYQLKQSSKDKRQIKINQFDQSSRKINLKGSGKMNFNSQLLSRIQQQKPQSSKKIKVEIRKLCLCQHIEFAGKYKGSLTNYAFTNNKTLKSINIDDYQQSIVDKTFLCKNIPELTAISVSVLNLKTLQVSQCPKLQILHLQSVDKIQMKKFIAEFLNLSQLFIKNITIDSFKITISTKAIKKIGLINIVIGENSFIQFNEDKSKKIELQLLEFSRLNLIPSQIIFQLFERINSIQTFNYQNIIDNSFRNKQFKSHSLSLDKFSTKIDCLYLKSQKDTQNKMKIQLNNPVKIIELNTQDIQLQLIYAFSLSIRNTKKLTAIINQDQLFMYQRQQIQIQDDQANQFQSKIQSQIDKGFSKEPDKFFPKVTQKGRKDIEQQPKDQLIAPNKQKKHIQLKKEYLKDLVNQLEKMPSVEKLQITSLTLKSYIWNNLEVITL